LVVFRLGFASDIQDIVLWWVTLPIAFLLPALFGYNFARWRFFKRYYTIDVEMGEGEEHEDECN